MFSCSQFDRHCFGGIRPVNGESSVMDNVKENSPTLVSLQVVPRKRRSSLNFKG